MGRVGIIGGGAFGTAMACVMRRAGHDTTLWAREPEVIASINQAGVNASFLSGVRLPHGIRATPDLALAAADMDYVLVAPPAQHLRDVAIRLRAAIAPGTPVVSCSKGIERGTCALMPEVLAHELPSATVAVLSGPSFAREVASDLPCAVAVACVEADVCAALARDLATPNFCVYPTDDVVGTAIGGVLKNVVAIASGIAAGKKLGENARATIITLGLQEGLRLAIAKGAHVETFLGLAGIGDLALTANSLQSRNTSLGVALGEGRRLADVIAERKTVTEGAFSVAAIVTLAHRLGVRMPIAEALDRVLNHGADLDGAIAQWMQRITHTAAHSL